MFILLICNRWDVKYENSQKCASSIGGVRYKRVLIYLELLRITE